MKEQTIVKYKKMTLSELRKQLKMTQADLARALDVHTNTIKKWEYGDRMMSLEVTQVQSLSHLLSKIGKTFDDLETNPCNRHKKPLHRELSSV